MHLKLPSAKNGDHFAQGKMSQLIKAKWSIYASIQFAMISSGTGLSPVWCQVIIWISADLSLTHWGRVTHICVDNLTIIGPDNGLSPGRRQAIIWTNDGILLIGPWGTNFSELLIGIQIFSFKKMHLKMSSAKWRPFCLGLNVLSGSLGKIEWNSNQNITHFLPGNGFEKCYVEIGGHFASSSVYNYCK